MLKLTPAQLSGPRLKLERAEKHVRDAEELIGGFLNLRPYTTGENSDPQSGQTIYYMSRVEDVPAGIGIVVGDALNNLRGSLDHLAMQIHVAGGGSPDNHRISYPMANSRAEFSATFHGKIKITHKSTIDVLEKAESYQGGKGHVLWVLDKLNNIDKHRRINVIGTSFNGFCVHPVVNKILREKVKANPSIIGTTPAGFWFRPEHDRSPLKVGDKLYGCPSDSKLDEDVQFAFEIAFNEPSVGECKPVVLFLDKTAKRIQSLIDQFA